MRQQPAPDRPGLLLYAGDNRASIPERPPTAEPDSPCFTGAIATDPFGTGGPTANDVTAALFLLVRNCDMNPEVFVCPSSNLEKDTLNNKPANQRSNFTAEKNLSYSYANPYVADKAVGLGYKLNGTWRPILRSRPTAMTATQTSRRLQLRLFEQRKINSRNHDSGRRERAVSTTATSSGPALRSTVPIAIAFTAWPRRSTRRPSRPILRQRDLAELDQCPAQSGSGLGPDPGERSRFP